MSISTSGGNERQPSTVKVDKTTGAGKPPAAGKTGARPDGKGPQGKGGGKGRKPVTPVKVSGGRNWGPIAVAGAVALVALAIIGVGVFYTVRDKSTSWEQAAADIEGISNYRKSDPKMVEGSQHRNGAIQYTVQPPPAGPHNGVPQNCMGDVYNAPIANEHAVHSLEHGAVWVTYKQGLPADQVAVLQKKVQGKDFILMSPYPGLDKNVSVQVWGYQLKADDVNDARIDQFIKDTRLVASMEPGAPCSSGNTTTGPVAPAGAPAAGS